jgi:hypothetical protein
MDFWRTVVVLFRRWYITIPAFFATLGLAGAAYSVVPIEYESGSVLVLTTPLSGGTEATQPNHPNALSNPLMSFDQSLALTASLIIQQLNSSETATALGIVPGDTTTYSVNNGSTNPELLQSGPFIFVDGKAPSPEAAKAITKRVSAMAARILDERQNELDAPASTHIEMQMVVAPTNGQPLLGSPLRAAAAVAALSALASLAAVYGFESLMTYRRRRRQERAAAEAALPAERAESYGQPAKAGDRNRSEEVLEPHGSLHLIHAGSAREER